MKNCTHCKYAEWKRTEAGKLHPSGDGRCIYQVRIPSLPMSMYWNTYGAPPKPMGGFINRREELRDHCPYYTAKSMPAVTEKHDSPSRAVAVGTPSHSAIAEWDAYYAGMGPRPTLPPF